MLFEHFSATPEQLAQIQSFPADTPVTMLNLLRFKTETESGEKGADVYERYFKNARPFVQACGAKLIWKGEVPASAVHDLPHVIFLVEYPSTAAFFGMVSNPDYQKIAADRGLALEFGGLIACKNVDQ